MTGQRRTDLAWESHRMWQEGAGETTQLPGVRARECRRRGFPVTRVEILDEAGAKALGKPAGTYTSVDLRPYFSDRSGLAVGHLLVTRHLAEQLPQLRAVAAAAAGVLGTTGLESAEWVQGLARQVDPAAVIVIDALAARSVERLCGAVQVADTGIVPGSGVGNARVALSRETLGVPVVSVGVPTVVDAVTLALDLMGEGAPLPEGIRDRGGALFVTPKDVDAQVRDVAKVVGYAINLALQPGLTVADLEALLN